MNKVGFPGLGIDPFEIDPIAFTIFGKEIAWYGIIITCGMLLAVMYVLWRSKLERVKSDHIYDLALCVILSGVVGARLYYVLMRLDNYDSFMDVIAIWEGGLAIYGGVIAGALAAIVYAKVTKLNPLKLLDMIGPATMIGQMIGRWGNFVNAEAFGADTTLPWRMLVQRPNWGYALEVHPTFLYESLWNLVGFIIINLLYKKKKYNGQIFVMYLTWYGFGRMLIEGLRTDSLYIFDTVRVSQLVGFLCFALGSVILLYFGAKHRKKPTVFERIAAKEAAATATAHENDSEGSTLTSNENITDGESEAETPEERNENGTVN